MLGVKHGLVIVAIWNCLFGFASGMEARESFIPIKIVTGSSHICALAKEGKIRCWGENFKGALGTGDKIHHGLDLETMGSNLQNVDLGMKDGDVATNICAGAAFTCAVTESGRVKCWGSNLAGELGQGKNSFEVYAMGASLPFTDLGRDFLVKDISCGLSSVCALSDKGLVKCWGENQCGQLGLGHTSDVGKTPATMGDALKVLGNGSPLKASSISLGRYHSCAVSNDGVRCWGYGAFGRLGLESTKSRGGTPDTVPNMAPNVTLGSNLSLMGVSSGATHTCALIRNNNSNKATAVKCWGRNDGNLGTGNQFSYGSVANSMGDFLPAVDLALDEIVSVNAHLGFNCVLTKTGRIKCWGSNLSGELGQGDNLNRGAQPSDMGDKLRDVDLGLPAKSLSIGSNASMSCAILINNEIKCWGLGQYGQLGYESGDNVGVNPDQMGSQLPFVRYK